MSFNNKKLIQDNLDSLFSFVQPIRHHLHQYPEIGGTEVNTNLYISKILSDLNIEHYSSAGYGVIGTIYGSGKAKRNITIALRADIDALPIEEKADISFKSKNKGVMHACGHDIHTSILLGVAKYFSEHKNLLNGNIKLIFQPAEETTGGAEKMILEGCLSSPKVDSVIGLHVSPNIPSGKIQFFKGVMNAASTIFSIKVTGTSCHGAHPEKGCDALLAASSLVVSLQSIVSRNISATDSAIITVGKFNSGTKTNIIAGEAQLEGIIRVLNMDMRQYIKDRICNLANSIVSAYGCKCQINYEDSYPVLVNDDRIYSLLLDSTKQCLGEEQIIECSTPSLGTDDFSYFCQKVPSLYFDLGTGYTDGRYNHPIHNEYFNADETCMKNGMLTEICSAIYLIENL